MSTERGSIFKRIASRSNTISASMQTGRNPKIENGLAGLAWVVGGHEIHIGAPVNGVFAQALAAGLIILNVLESKRRVQMSDIEGR